MHVGVIVKNNMGKVLVILSTPKNDIIAPDIVGAMEALRVCEFLS
jgi:hypothetical protein